MTDFPHVVGVEHRFVEAAGPRSSPGAGHFICDTHPQLVAARVRSYLA